jgi:hypothetical protein
MFARGAGSENSAHFKLTESEETSMEKAVSVIDTRRAR